MRVRCRPSHSRCAPDAGCCQRLQGYYCGFPTGKATPPNPCTKPYNPWLAPPRIAHADAGTSDDEEPLPAYGCHLHHTFRLSNIAHYGVKDTWTDFGQWHDRESDGE